jgi:ribonuclease T2
MRLLRATGVIVAIAAAASVLAVPAEARHRHHKSYGYPAQVEPEVAPEAESAQPSAPAPYRSSSERNVAGQFDYYALVLSWSPAFCADGTHSDSPQCATSGSRPFSFVLHGLWPQYQKGWPQDCRTESSPYVPDPLINQMLDIMPAKKLIIHEYRKHGTCSGLSPQDYFALSRKLFTSIKIPQRFQNPAQPQTVSPDLVMSEFMQNNPDIKPNMIAVGCGGPGNKMKDVHICISQDGKPTSCGRNENQSKMCSAPSMAVLPVRAGGGAIEQQTYSTEPVAAPKKTLSGAILQYFGKR